MTEKINRVSQVVNNTHQEVKKYKKNLRRIEQNAAQVSSYGFKQLHRPKSAPWYQKARQEWAEVSGELAGWADSTLSSVIALPEQMIENSRNQIIPTLDSAIQEADHLIEHPGSTRYRDALHDDLSFLEIRLQRDIRRVRSVVSYMKGGKDKFEKGANLMKEIAEKAKNTAEADKKKVKELNEKIDRLHSEIRSAAVGVAGGSLATVGGVVFGVVGIALAPATGGVSLALLVPAAVITGGGLAAVGLSAKRIVELKQEIRNASKKIDEYNADITILQKMNADLNGLSKRVEGVKGSIDQIVKPWDAMREYFSSTRERLKKLSSSQDWSDVKSSLQEVKQTWQSHVKMLKELKQAASEVSTSNELEIGMNAREVREAIPPNTRQQIVPYIEHTAGTW